MCDLNKEYVVGVGAANVDLHGHSHAPIVMRDSNPGILRTSAGGVTRNVMENLARQGVPVHMLSAVGDDVYGEVIRRASRSAGIGMDRVMTVQGAASSCYLAVLDERGDMLIGMSDMSILQNLDEAYLRQNLELLRGAAAVVCDPCLPLAVLRLLTEDLDLNKPIFLDPVSTAYARAVEPIVGKFYCVQPNRMELAVLSGTDTDSDEGVMRGAEALLRRGVRQVAVSLGERGCYYADDAGHQMFRALRPMADMVNATGAGDAFMSGLVHGSVLGLTPEDKLDYALAAGLIAIKSELTISPDMSDAAIHATIKAYKE